MEIEMHYVWVRDLETGNAVIDEQHKRLFAAQYKLFEAYRSGREQQGAAEILQFLTAYTLEHFADEEKLLQESGYPEYAAHKQLHAEFGDVIQKLAAKWSLHGPSDDLLLEVCTVIHEWLVIHIKQEDRKFVQYIQSRQS